MTADFAFKSLLLLPVIAFPFIYLIGRASVRLSTRNTGTQRNPAKWIALFVMLLLVMPLVIVVKQFTAQGPFSTFIGSIELKMDGVGILMSIVVVLMSLAVVLFSDHYMSHEVGEEKYYALLVCMTGMVMGMVTSTDLFNLWVWFEAMAITPYILVAFYHDRAPALEAGVKYLFQSAAGTMLVLFGIILVFMHTGSLCLGGSCAIEIPKEPALVVAGLLFITGFGVKAALVPMHTWLPDAHSQAPSGVSAILSGVVIEAALIAMIRALDMISPVFTNAGTFLIILSVGNIILGNLLALRQTQVKRMLAFSSISHMGYIVLGIGITMSYGLINGAQGSFFHIVTHALMKGLSFMIVGALMHAYGNSKGDAHAPLEISDLNGVASRFPGLAFALSIGLLSLAGIPPLAGFMSKWQIFVAGFETGNPAMIGVVIFAALNSVLSLAYYAPLINRMYRQKPTPYLAKAGRIAFSMNMVFFALGILIIVVGVMPGTWNWLTNPAAQIIQKAFWGG